MFPEVNKVLNTTLSYLVCSQIPSTLNLVCVYCNRSVKMKGLKQNRKQVSCCDTAKYRE